MRSLPVSWLHNLFAVPAAYASAIAKRRVADRKIIRPPRLRVNANEILSPDIDRLGIKEILISSP